jgi:asparagine synthase (glutamine-hydrolysing)
LFQGYSSFRQLPRLMLARRIANNTPGAMALLSIAAAWKAQQSGNARWQHLPDWMGSMAGAWWLRRGLFAPSELPTLMGARLASQGLHGFSPDVWLNEMSGALPDNPLLALGQIESTTYMRNQLLRDSDWASMDHSVELRTPLVDAWLSRDLQPMLGAFKQFANKRLLAEAPAKPLPETLISRRKTGFGIPVQAWLKQMGVDNIDHGPSGAWAVEVAKRYERSHA